MADIRYYDVILKPIVTEKSMNAMGEKKYTFLVHPEANKSQIKEAVEKMFEGTKVKSVNTMNRIIDFKRRKDDVPATVKSIEYDPNRTANIALICYADGEKAYILAPEGLKVGMKVMSGAAAEVRPGNCLPLSEIPVGTMVHNVELHAGKGGQLVRAAGNGAQLMAKEGKYATLRLPSGEMRMVPINCRASIGVVGNGEHSLINIGKAGRKRNMGIRPTVRGSVMNPNDHPHGGGEGKTGIGRPGPSTPWGKPALGLKTRAKNKQSNKYIVRRRDGKALSK